MAASLVWGDIFTRFGVTRDDNDKTGLSVLVELF